ncbi:DUF5691 domain-containing protein [Solirubrobacter soli]|uniref:DUF5691 domain-containing protein n=1 Tax=Solirubrobacter soli TaxID=363832 RepID=UPI0003FF6E68|nr:DUF5691 domain-containing protein [Solirubrobacter soli]
MSGWDDLVAAALIGTDRRPVSASVPEGSPAGLEALLGERGVEDRLLGAAAAWTVARRAGAVARAGGEAAAPAELDPRPIAPGGALRQRLEGLYPLLLGEWLALAAARGLRPPPELVPALLEYVVEAPELHAAVAEAAGPLGAWLAERHPEWAFVRGASEDVDAVWSEGGTDERRTLLERLRGTDPAGARELLERTFADETWEDRAAFLATFAIGLTDADEPLLELALDDRRKPVREEAATLLTALPRSRFAARMAARSAPLLRVEDGRLLATLPGDPDDAAKRDGVPTTGRRSERLHALLAATPLATWTGAESPPPGAHAPSPRAGTSPPAPLTHAATAPASPADLVRLDVADDLAGVVHGAWRDAAVAQGDAEWARALWAVMPDPALLAALPHAEAQRRAAEAEFPEVAATAVPGPWGETLTRALLAALKAHRGALDYGQDVSFAGERMDPALAEEAEEQLREVPGRDVRRLCDIVSARAAMLRELS